MVRKSRSLHATDMSPKDIRMLMTKYGETISGIARAVGVSPATVHNVIHRGTVSHRVRLAICAAIRKDPKLVYPSTYLYQGGPRRPGRPREQPSPVVRQNTVSP